jgi:uncharacterized protein (TIGR03435 family)
MSKMKSWILAIPASAALSAQTFDVASVKSFHDDGVSARNSRVYGPQGVNFGGCSLGFIIGEAYIFPVGRISGPREWISPGFDIVGNADHAVSKDEVRRMLQSLLVERFKLAIHKESKTERLYRLTVGAGGPKLTESQDAGGSFTSRADRMAMSSPTRK